MKTFIAPAIAVDPVHVFVLCPWCSRVHTHGSAGDIGRQKYGTRGPHCLSNDFSPDYEIVTDQNTIRSQVPILSVKIGRDGHIKVKQARGKGR